VVAVDFVSPRTLPFDIDDADLRTCSGGIKHDSTEFLHCSKLIVNDIQDAMKALLVS
jgi:hypothetical protein